MEQNIRMPPSNLNLLAYNFHILFMVKETENTTQAMKGSYMFSTGKRKTAVASVRLYNGDGTIMINDKPLKDFVHTKYESDVILSPLIMTDMRTKISCMVYVEGGGRHAQLEAIRHGISKALIDHELMLRPTLKKAGFLTRDSRVKERKKPGLRRARRSPQWAKR